MRVGCVVNGEVRFKPDRFCLVSQDAREDRVEGTHPKASGIFLTHQFGNPRLHLPGRFIGKGEREDVVGGESLLQ